MTQADIALIGLAVMGQNLVLNMADHGFTVAVYNRTTSVVDAFVEGPAQGKTIIGTHSLEEMVATLKRPRRVMLLVKAGQPVDDFIEKLIPLLEPGDIIIDGGNSNYEDTIRRTAYVESKGLLFIGSGVSGGEEGARHGPSIMPGGSPAAWPHVKPIFQAVAAKVPEGDPNGTPCCDWVGENGAGHFVKMVHNGIEYGDMQIIAEAYQLMKEGLGLSNDEMSAVFEQWNVGVLESYLIEITRDILAYRDDQGQAVLDLILDSAGQKGTGKWTVGLGARPGHAVDPRGRGSVRTLPVIAGGGTRRGREAAAWTCGRLHRGSRCAAGRPGTGGVCGQGCLVCAGVHVDAGCRQGVRLEPQPGRHRADVARRLHHPLRVPGQDQGCVRHRSRPAQPAAGPLFPGGAGRGRRRRGAAWWRRLCSRASRRPRCPVRWRSTMATAGSGCPRT